MKTSAVNRAQASRLPDSTPSRSRACARQASEDRITAFMEPSANAPKAIFALEDAHHQSGGAHFHEDGYDRSGGRDTGI